MFNSKVLVLIPFFSLSLAFPPFPTQTASSNSIVTPITNSFLAERDYQVGQVPNFPSNIPSCVGKD